MKKILIVLFLQFTYSISLNAQDLTELVEKLRATLSVVETAANNYEQEMKLNEYSSVTYSYKETDKKKGTSASFSCDFNFADIDPYAVREETQKDIIYVVLTARNKQKLFKSVKNGKTEPYDNELRIHARNIDHAREVLELIKKAIPIGEKITASKLKLDGYDNMRTWLEQHVIKVGDGTKTYDQTLKEQAFPGSFKLFQIESDGKTAKQVEYFFNIADINPNSVVFKISGNSFGVEFSMMDRLKSIGTVRDGQTKPYEDNLVVFTNGVDDARDIRNVITAMIPLAQAKVKADMPNTASPDEIFNRMSELLKDVKSGTTTFSNAMTGKCFTTVVVVEQTPSSAKKDSYLFNWLDVNPNLMKLDVSSDKMLIELPIMEKKKLVNHRKDDKTVGYQAGAEFYVENMEVGRRLKFLADKAITYCKNSYKDQFPSDMKGLIGWITSNVGEVNIEDNTVKQTFAPAEDGNFNKIKYERTEIKGTSSSQQTFEFNLSDINTSSVGFDISGKFLSVKFETNYRNKIIKAYKDGKIAPYVYQLEFVMQDTEVARGVIAALKKGAEGQKGK